jgi:hypothetical protein
MRRLYKHMRNVFFVAALATITPNAAGALTDDEVHKVAANLGATARYVSVCDTANAASDAAQLLLRQAIAKNPKIAAEGYDYGIGFGQGAIDFTGCPALKKKIGRNLSRP